MSLRYKTNLLEHAKAVGQWAWARDAEVAIDAVDLSLTVRRSGGEWRFLPQFVGKRDGQTLSYFDSADRFAAGFVGWLPHRPQAWDMSLSKLAFKQAAREAGVAVPACWMLAAEVTAPCLVKRARGAFGHGMQGPFRVEQAALLDLAEGEFFEAFHWGRIARAWYWRGELTVLEMFPMPTVTGDGVASYETLLRRASTELPPAGSPAFAAQYEPVALLQGVAPHDVPPAGVGIVCDYRYVSPLNPTLYANHNLLPRRAGSALVQRFADAGRRLWPRIPGPPDQQRGFVLDAIVDAHDRPWFLEINSNAQGHPDAYAAMLDAVCAA